jgi:hypothetical protein
MQGRDRVANVTERYWPRLCCHNDDSTSHHTQHATYLA